MTIEERVVVLLNEYLGDVPSSEEILAVLLLAIEDFLDSNPLIDQSMVDRMLRDVKENRQLRVERTRRAFYRPGQSIKVDPRQLSLDASQGQHQQTQIPLEDIEAYQDYLRVAHKVDTFSAGLTEFVRKHNTGTGKDE